MAGLPPHQLDDLSLDLMHGGALVQDGVVRLPVDAESPQKSLCCKVGKKNSSGES